MRQGKTESFRALPCRLPGVIAVVAESDRRFPRHSHDQFGIGLVMAGAQASLSGRGQVEAGPGDMITVNPGEVHDGAPIGDAGRGWSMLYIDPAVMADAAYDLTAGRQGELTLTHPVLADRRAAMLFRGLFAAMTKGQDAGLLDVQSSFLRLLAFLLETRLPDTRAHGPGIGRAIEMMEMDPAAALTLERLAAVAGLDPFQFLRAFARQTGLTPHAYLLQRRVDLARRLIRAGDGLADVAAASGFADQSHLTRHFGRLYGITPAAFARAAR